MPLIALGRTRLLPRRSFRGTGLRVAFRRRGIRRRQARGDSQEESGDEPLSETLGGTFMVI